MGVSRLNVGVQSFEPSMLAACGRAHSAADVHAALAAVRASGVHSWGLDLISGLPGLTPALWDETLAAAVAAAPQHVSVYDLQVEARTAFGRWYTPGERPLPSDGEAADMYRAAHAALTAAGYEHYEVSNYALPGHACAHNLRYWRDQEWHAFGVAAANHVRGLRFTRPRRLAEYLAWVRDGCRVDAGAGEGPEEQLLDALMLGLRMSEGLDVAHLGRRFGNARAERVVEALRAHEDARLVEVERTSAGAARRVRLTAPEGFLLSNSVLADVFARL